ncbi:sterol desaturase family protein [Sphingobacterium sp. N143]|uniref:sterol desaturase family protein n=1 Tax=Sphingobacterium sp. N143 TaxID=2746727 RepID=UPI00257558D7|nr:sterol desaturase family protein [Sphingobacterium sp. N143]MDM1292988.1 sterol desaturase family protein [Sphingobacterium sp. N143]
MHTEKLNFLAFIIPLFLLLMVLEYGYSLKQQKHYYTFDESVANLNVGIVERMCDMFSVSLFYFFFVWVYQHFAIFDIQANLWTWLLLFLFTDFLWYWYHRYSHEVNLLWAAHVVHHQSEDYNFTVAARITIFQAVFRSLFWAFIPLLGFPPFMMTAILLIHGVYPFFSHTQTVGNLGVLEKVFVTPSHHRVHHSSNDIYLDKNYGDILIIWDKLFGTFISEQKDQPCVYGLTKPIHRYTFLWQHFHYLFEIGLSFKRAEGVKNKLRTIFGRPDDIQPEIREKLEQKIFAGTKSRVHGKRLSRYIFFQSMLTMLLLFFFLLFGNYQQSGQLMVGGLFILCSVICIGGLLEHEKWVFQLEIFRVLLLLLFAWMTLHLFGLLLLLGAVIFVLLLFYNGLKHRYDKILYS